MAALDPAFERGWNGIGQLSHAPRCPDKDDLRLHRNRRCQWQFTRRERVGNARVRRRILLCRATVQRGRAGKSRRNDWRQGGSLRALNASAISVQPSKIMSIPMNSPITHSPESGHDLQIMAPNRIDIAPLSMSHPRWCNGVEKAMNRRNTPATINIMAMSNVRVTAASAGFVTIATPTTAYSTPPSRLMKKPLHGRCLKP